MRCCPLVGEEGVVRCCAAAAAEVVVVVGVRHTPASVAALVEVVGVQTPVASPAARVVAVAALRVQAVVVVVARLNDPWVVVEVRGFALGAEVERLCSGVVVLGGKSFAAAARAAVGVERASAGCRRPC